MSRKCRRPNQIVRGKKNALLAGGCETVLLLVHGCEGSDWVIG